MFDASGLPVPLTCYKSPYSLDLLSVSTTQRVLHIEGNAACHGKCYGMQVETLYLYSSTEKTPPFCA